jgi:uncharacterized protein (DUF4415 family)
MPKKKPDHISQEDWDSVESPPLTETMLRNLKPSRERMPKHLFDKLVQAQQQRAGEAKEDVTLSVDREVIEHFKAKGADWRNRMSAALRQAVRMKRERVPS